MNAPHPATSGWMRQRGVRDELSQPLTSPRHASAITAGSCHARLPARPLERPPHPPPSVPLVPAPMVSGRRPARRAGVDISSSGPPLLTYPRVRARMLPDQR